MTTLERSTAALAERYRLARGSQACAYTLLMMQFGVTDGVRAFRGGREEQLGT